MAILRAFHALRPQPAQVSKIAAVPYDVVNREEARVLASDNPLSFLHVSRPEIDLPSGTDPHSAEVYHQAKVAFEKLRLEGPLIQEPKASLYVYRLKQGSHEQIGIFGTFSIDEYDSDRIKKHERTRQDKEDDRTRHLLELGAQTGPVFLAYRKETAIQKQITETREQEPLFDFTAVDGVSHTLWKVADPSHLVSLFEQVRTLYIADGHHRAASASRARAQLRAANPKHDGTEPYNFVLAVAFSAEDLRILPYHRLVRDLNGRSEKGFLDEIRVRFEITPGAGPEPRRGEFAMYLDGKWWGLSPRLAGGSASVPDGTPTRSLAGTLDVSILQDQLLEPILGIKDPRTDKRIDFVGGIRGTAELEKRVDSGECKVAFALHPTTLEDLFRISDAGEIMPPKSTWFEPKLRDGLLVHKVAVI